MRDSNNDDQRDSGCDGDKVMSCDSCDSERVADINAKCGDLVTGGLVTKSFNGEVPEGFGIGGGDYVNFCFCLDCGKIQGDFPLPPTEIEEQ
jgi:hypothetical protein